MSRQRSPQLRAALEALPAMPLDRIVEQPPEVYLKVEEYIAFGWHFAASATVRAADPTLNVDVSAGSGWLKAELVSALQARGVPVGPMFTLAALERRPRG
jgi:hypothetical protein